MVNAQQIRRTCKPSDVGISPRHCGIPRDLRIGNCAGREGRSTSVEHKACHQTGRDLSGLFLRTYSLLLEIKTPPNGITASIVSTVVLILADRSKPHRQRDLTALRFQAGIANRLFRAVNDSHKTRNGFGVKGIFRLDSSSGILDIRCHTYNCSCGQPFVSHSLFPPRWERKMVWASSKSSDLLT